MGITCELRLGFKASLEGVEGVTVVRSHRFEFSLAFEGFLLHITYVAGPLERLGLRDIGRKGA